MHIPSAIAAELSLRLEQVDTVLSLFAEGATVPFIARYRKERTGLLDEEMLRSVEDRFQYLTILEDRKQAVLSSIEEQGKLTDELRKKITDSGTLREVEDLYLPFKPKRKTRGTMAKAKGLEPLALFFLENPTFKGTAEKKAEEFVNEELGVATTADAIQGAKDIIAEMISEHAETRAAVRDFYFNQGKLASSKIEGNVTAQTENLKMKDKEKKDVYRVYEDFKVQVSTIKPYQYLALNRGEREKFLRVGIAVEEPSVCAAIKKTFFPPRVSTFDALFDETTADSLKRLIAPSIEREVRNDLAEIADAHAIEIFASNLKGLLLQPPLAGFRILGIDPGFASGCKLAVIDETGKYLAGETMYPHPPRNKSAEAEAQIARLIKSYNIKVVAIGNGTASRETESLVVSVLKKYSLDCSYTMVNEAGASVYSASDIARYEFPDLEASQRGNISIARRLLDPLAELVKIDPKSIGVGLYQHDVDQKALSKKLGDVVVSCVNYVGVDVNTASVSLLTYVSGLNKRLAENIVKRREEIGKYSTRKELLGVSGLGPKTFEQCAGFLKIPGGTHPFDNTFIHPESYDAAQALCGHVKINLNELTASSSIIDLYLKQKSLHKLADELNVGEPTLEDIIENLKKPGRDPREDMPKPILRSDVVKPEDLQPGMKLKGTVRNVVDFGAFVDIGVKQDGLIHVSQMKNKFVKNPLEIVHVGDVIEVTVLTVDIERGRISLSLKE